MANDITILSCPICNNPKLREYGNGIYQCDVCETYFDKNENVVLTEQEWLQMATTEQLAEAILLQWIHGAYHGVGEFGLTDKEIESARDGIVEWLKEIHHG